MAKHIQEFDGWVDEHNWPKVACPECSVGNLDLAEKPRHLLDPASAEIVDVAHRNMGPPDELSGAFIGELACDNSACGRNVAIAGDWQLVFNEGDPALGQFGDIYRLRYANPPLRLINLPTATPGAVRSAVDTAAALIWISPASAASRLRQAVEALLTARRVKRFVTSGGKRRRLTLHKRIDIFKKTNPEVADALLAMKWIGNDGTHEHALTIPQVLLGATILEAAINALYDKSAAQLAAEVKKINAKGGLAKAKT